jgi:anti-anti-sigma factor
MSLEIACGADSTTVVVVGDVDMASTDLFEEAMDRLGSELRKLVVDLGGVTFIDSTGLSMLVRLHRACVANGGSLVVVAPSEPARRLFEISKVDEVLTIVG